MTNVILVSVLGPPRLICGTHDAENLTNWWNTDTPKEFPGYVCNRIKHLTGETFLAIVQDAARSGYILITHDQGHNWSIAYRFASDQPVTLEVGNGYAFVAGGEGVYRSRDGYNWTLLSGSPKSVQNFAVFSNGYVMAHNGAKLFRSYNSGGTWEEINSPIRGAPYPWFDTIDNPGVPSFAVAGKSPSYVVASMGAALWATTNFGDSWTKLIQWSSWFIPRELHYTRGNTFVLKMRKLMPNVEEINSISVSSDNCRSFVDKFNQDVTWEHQIEYIRPLDLLLVGHTRYMEPKPFETWLDRFVPAIMYSNGAAQNFTEVVSPVFGKTFSIIAISGWINETPSYEMDIIIKKTIGKNYQAGIRLKNTPKKDYTADILLQKRRTNTLSMDLLVKKRLYKTFKLKMQLLKVVDSNYLMNVKVASRIRKPYTMDMILKKIGHAYYKMQCLKRKTVPLNFGMSICIVGDYRKPLKRDVMLAFPQPFALEVENANYVLRQDIQIRRVDEVGY